MRPKKVGDWITVLLIIGTLISMVYVGTAWAINRIVGFDEIAGDGLIRADGGTDKDTFHVEEGAGLAIDNDSVVVLQGKGLTFDTDSLIVNATWGLGFVADALICLYSELDDSLVTLFSDQSISGEKTFTDTLQIGEGGSDGLFKIYSEEGATDQYVLFKPHADMTQDVVYVLPADDGTADQYLKSDGSGNLSWDSPTGSGDITAVGDITSGDAFTATAGNDGTTLYFEGSTANAFEVALTTGDPGADVTVTIPATAGNIWVDAQTDIIKDTHIDWGTGVNQVSATDMPDFGTMTATSGNILVADGADFESVAMSGDVTIATGGATSIGDDKVIEADLKVTGGIAVDEDILTYEATIGDFEWHTPAELGMATESAIGDTANAVRGEIRDTMEAIVIIDRFISPTDPAIDRNMNQELEMLYPITKGNYDWTCEYTSRSADQKDTICVFSARIPMGIDGNGLDSISFNAYTTGIAVGDASIEVMVYKRTSDGGAKVAIDSLAEFNTGGAWSHQTITGFGTNVSAGDWLKIDIIINCDNADTVWHDKTYAWYTGK